jgi:hypothetical protein
MKSAGTFVVENYSKFEKEVDLLSNQYVSGFRISWGCVG